MIQFNLLPDVKLEYIKAVRVKRMVMVGATIASSISLAILILLFLVVNVFQAKQIRDLTKDIKRDSSKLESIPDLSKILTIQNQLKSLPDLHAKKVVASRTFTFLKQVTPDKLNISSLNIDFTAQTMTFTGTADKLETVNRFVDTLKFTDYQGSNTGDTKTRAFSSVVLSSFGQNDKAASYTVDLKFDPLIYDGAQEVTLVVPKTITTRSETEKPEALFQTNQDAPAQTKTNTNSSTTTPSTTGSH